MKYIFLLLMTSLSLFSMMRDDMGLAEEGILYIAADYKEAFELPPESVLHVRVEDVSQMDVIATTIESGQKSIKGYPPFSLRLDVDPRDFKKSRRYGLRVMISHKEKLLFINDYYINPLKPPFDITLKKVTHNK
ncbi:MAG: YbaY family lipoprotein [Campylobacterota bacterium]|nr:YbaY family lipoprotein [Campylobacterota bacterium]